jgi:hypothetical protein
MKANKKRYLTYFSPELKRKTVFPVNFSFTQFYALDTGDEDQKKFEEDTQLVVRVDDYATDHFAIFSTLGKPISKIIR